MWSLKLIMKIKRKRIKEFYMRYRQISLADKVSPTPCLEAFCIPIE